MRITINKTMKRLVGIALVIGGAGFAAYAQEKPAWVDNPSAAYPARLYVSAVGYGRDRRSAEGAALASLAAFFRQSVSGAVSITDREIQSDGKSVSSSSMSQTISAVAAMDALIGAEIKAVWEDARGGAWYAAAVMEKAAGRERYGAELDKALRGIDGLIDAADGVTFETIARCGAARERAGEADMYALVLSMLDGPDRREEVSRSARRVEAALAEARSLPVDVRVTGDVDGRFRAAFAGAFTAAGFKTGNRNSRYALLVSYTASPAPKSAYFNTRYTVNAVLVDTKTEAELFTYSASSRESHPAGQEQADGRAVMGALRKITAEFPAVLQEYLDAAY